MTVLLLLATFLLVPQASEHRSGVLRERVLQAPSHEALQAVIRGLRDADRADFTFAFEPFPDVPLRLQLDLPRPGFLAEIVLSGRVVGDPSSRARFVIHGDVLIGDVTSPVFGTFELCRDASGRCVVREVDRSSRTVCRAAVTGPEASSAAAPGARLSPSTLAPAPGPPGTAPDRTLAAPPDAPVGETIDVMVVYTPSAAAQAGGVPGIEATIDLYLDYTNQAYADSGVLQRLRLVRAAQVAYVESGNSLTDLARLRFENDGFMDGVHADRDAFGADCVCLLATSGSAGVAYLMTPVSPAFEDRAFSAVGPDAGGIAFAHELAHNMGCGHNNGAGAPPAAFCFSYGYRTPDNAWRTIMSSAPGTHVDLFSSPALRFGGFPLGISGEGCPTDGADCVATLNATAPTVAGFRPTMVP